MVENIRSITMGIEIDTNKKTVNESRTFDSTQDMIPQLRNWLVMYDFPHDADSPEEQPQRHHTGTRIFAREVGRCDRCKGRVEASYVVETRVDLNRMIWNERVARPTVEANTRIMSSKVVHECSDAMDKEDD